MSDDAADEDEPIRCDVCGDTFESEEAVREHLLDQGILR
jgi:hypothetical protein